MKKLFLLAPLMLAATPAAAADLAYKAPSVVAPLPEAWTWEGFYMGLQAGYGFGSTGEAELSPFAFPGLITAFTPAGQPAGSSFNANGSFNDGFVGGAHIGYDWQAGNIVVGAVLDISYADLGDEQRAFSRSPADYVVSRELDFLATLRARLGYAFNERFLVYATGGLAYGDVDISYRQGSASPAAFTTQGGQDSDFGYTVGGGVETRFTQNISFSVEYLYTNLGGNDFQANLNNGPFGGAGGAPGSSPTGTVLTGSDDDFDFHTVSAKIAYRF